MSAKSFGGNAQDSMYVLEELGRQGTEVLYVVDDGNICIGNRP